MTSIPLWDSHPDLKNWTILKSNVLKITILKGEDNYKEDLLLKLNPWIENYKYINHNTYSFLDILLKNDRPDFLKNGHTIARFLDFFKLLEILEIESLR